MVDGDSGIDFDSIVQQSRYILLQSSIVAADTEGMDDYTLDDCLEQQGDALTGLSGRSQRLQLREDRRFKWNEVSSVWDTSPSPLVSGQRLALDQRAAFLNVSVQEIADGGQYTVHELWPLAYHLVSQSVSAERANQWKTLALKDRMHLLREIAQEAWLESELGGFWHMHPKWMTSFKKQMRSWKSGTRTWKFWESTHTWKIANPPNGFTHDDFRDQLDRFAKKARQWAKTDFSHKPPLIECVDGDNGGFSWEWRIGIPESDVTSEHFGAPLLTLFHELKHAADFSQALALVTQDILGDRWTWSGKQKSLLSQLIYIGGNEDPRAYATQPLELRAESFAIVLLEALHQQHN